MTVFRAVELDSWTLTKHTALSILLLQRNLVNSTHAHYTPAVARLLGEVQAG